MEGEDSDTEVYLQGESDDEEQYDVSGRKSKLQFRKDPSKARWSDELGLAEVVERKGRMWTTTGVVRSSKLYCTIEETLFLAEIGALVLLGDSNGGGDADRHLSLKDMYEKVVERKNGSCHECFEIYRHMKSLGYILRRHDMPWSVKIVNSKPTSENNGEKGMEPKEIGYVIELLGGLEINGARPVFDVYLPNSKFRKSSPGVPSFIICLTGCYPPSKSEVEALRRQCGGVPLKFCHIEHGRVSFFSFDRVELPLLP